MPADLGDSSSEQDSGYSRLDSQIRWYNERSNRAQSLYKRFKIFEIVCAISAPIFAQTYSPVAAFLGGVVVLLEALQHINQWSQNWITYRSTCEALRHEKYLYLAGADVYEDGTDIEKRRVLAERVEALISTEHARWVSRQEYKTTKEHQN